MSLPSQVRIVEVGARDGLQNESTTISVETRLGLIERLVAAGLTNIEAGSFVNPKWIPQMASSDQVFAALPRRPGISFSALTPNMKGFEAALEAGADEVAVFAAASEAFSQKNINCSVAESLLRFEPVMAAASAAGKPVRGYVSCVLGCPYEGEISPRLVAEVTGELLDGKLVEWHVGIERVDHPVAPRPVVPGGVSLEPVGIAVARAVEPPHRHPLTKVRRG